MVKIFFVYLDHNLEHLQHQLNYVFLNKIIFSIKNKFLNKLFSPRVPLTRFGTVARRIETRSRRESRAFPRQCEDDIHIQFLSYCGCTYIRIE